MNLYVISGATGMTGSELVRQLLGKGHSIIGFDNFFASSINTIKSFLQCDRMNFFEYDINNTVQMEKVKEMVLEMKERFDKLIYINCAAVVHTEHFYYVNRTFDTNVLGMRSFMNQAISVGADVFINCSTSEVYSMQSWAEDGVRESDFITMADAEHSQRTSYATGKLLTEFFIKDAVDDGKIKGCSIRFANVYSKNELYPKHIIPHILHSLNETGKVVLLENSKKNRRTFLNNIDSCAAVIALCDTEAALDGTTYNVATSEEITIVDLVKLCAQKLGIDDYAIIFEGYRESDPERRLLNIDKIRSKTTWKPVVTLSEGIEQCVEELRK